MKKAIVTERWYKDLMGKVKLFRSVSVNGKEIKINKKGTQFRLVYGKPEVK